MKKQVVIPSIKAEIDVHDREPNYRDRRSHREYNKAARVYFFHKGESILENFGNRAARPRDLYKKFLPQVAEAMGLPKDTKFRWSRYAGCSCPCSPGFICDEVYRKDVYVTLSPEAPKTSNDPQELAEAASRITQLVNDPTMPFNTLVERTVADLYSEEN